MFRFGTKPIEEGQHIVFKCGTVKPKPWTRNQERFYHWRYAVGWMGNFIFFGVGLWYMSATLTPSPTPILNRVPSPSPSPSSSPNLPEPASEPELNPNQVHERHSPLLRARRDGLDARGLAHEHLHLLVRHGALAPSPSPYSSLPLTLPLPLTRFIMEPGFIFILIALPCICNNKYVDTCNDRLGDIGCDISMFLG